MSTTNPFPHLLVLLSDPSPVVREELRKAFLPMASQLKGLLEEHGATDLQRTQLSELLFAWRKSQLLAGWSQWHHPSDPRDQLEQAQTLLCEYEYGWRDPHSLQRRLDDLSQAFQGGAEPLTELPEFLFAKRLQGNREDYYSPANSFLSEVIRQGRGNPISLSVVLMLVGRRLGLNYWGCNFPGHFLASFRTGSGTRYVDAFHGGQIMDAGLRPEMRSELSDHEVRSILAQTVTPEQILGRMLRNLVASYLQLEQPQQSNLFSLLLKDLSARAAGLGRGCGLREPLYFPGQLVMHGSKGYRGVVVDYSLYETQPDGSCHEPTYRVLVHGSPQVATAMESQLQPDQGGLVAHPFVSVFFTRFEKGAYLRNSRPWEG